jgi:hypothetical protein
VRWPGAPRALAAAGAAALAGCLAAPLADASEASPKAPREPRSYVGALGPPQGKFVVSGEAGMIFVLPTLSVAAVVGLGAGVSAEIRYRNLAVLGHAGKLRLAWGRRISRTLLYGVALRTSITSLAQADGGLIGIQFSNLAVGNDWLVGSDLSLTWLRPGSAHITASFGPTFTLGGLRYQSFDDRSFRVEPKIRAVTGSVQGEWELWPRFNVFLRLDADVLLGTEIVPLGFIPTGVVGFGWSL